MKFSAFIFLLFVPVFSASAVPVLLPAVTVVGGFFVTIFCLILAGLFFFIAFFREHPRRFLFAGVVFLIAGLLYYFYV